MAKILGNDVVTTQEHNDFNTAVIIPLINEVTQMRKTIRYMSAAYGVTVTLLLISLGYLINK
jgi:hypothetical protein